ncbi:uncharacterized protein NPIL_31591 [Nephila pilipes]|uniref:Uncharacterized protein n=1 Tax=Nephila pilipes TaxID=299642 RepID=A0A8X6QL43_NEPPI|nr:uncharacterized protein NPIL_31591 [Nephila pilipes]
MTLTCGRLTRFVRRPQVTIGLKAGVLSPIEQADEFHNLINSAGTVAIKQFLDNYWDEGDIRSLIGAGGLNMPGKERPLGPPPHVRPNWCNLNEGQRRYAYEQYNLARIRRGLPIDHPIPSADSPVAD